MTECAGHGPDYTRIFRAKADELIECFESEAWPGNPPWLNVVFRGNSEASQALSGGGIYAIFLDDRLVYIGIYAGKKSDPFGGSVLRDRWLKHMGTMTFRGKKLSLRPASLTRVRAESISGSHGFPLLAELSSAGANITRSQGMEASFRKAMFLAKNPDLVTSPIGASLRRFEVGYVRLAELTQGSSKQALKRRLCEAEANLVGALFPPLNSATPSHLAVSDRSIDEVMNLVVQELDRPSVSDPAIKPSREKVQSSPESIGSLEDEEDEEPMLAFLERADEACGEFLRCVQDLCLEQNRLILYFTHNGKVARIATADPSARRRRPLAILEWRARTRGLRLRSRLAATALKEFGLVGAPCRDTQMLSEAELDCSEFTARRVVEICLRTAKVDQASDQVTKVSRNRVAVSGTEN